MIKYFCKTVHLMASLATAMIVSLVALQPAQAGSGLCPTFSSSDIESKYLEWLTAVGQEVVDTLPVQCRLSEQYDFYQSPPQLPGTFLYIGGELAPFFQVQVQALDYESAEANKFKAFAYAVVVDGGEPLWLTSSDVLTNSQKHVCIAEILKSFVWRQYCTGAK